MPWVATSLVGDELMTAHAAQRGWVRLQTGAVVQLVRWPLPGRHHRRGRYARVENTRGGRFTVHVREIVEMFQGEGMP
jgi:hypothetical protein